MGPSGPTPAPPEARARLSPGGAGSERLLFIAVIGSRPIRLQPASQIACQDVRLALGQDVKRFHRLFGPTPQFCRIRCADQTSETTLIIGLVRWSILPDDDPHHIMAVKQYYSDTL